MTCTAIPARSALYLLTFVLGFSVMLMILRFKDALLYLAVIIGFSSLLSTVFWSLFLDVNLNINFAPRLQAEDSIYLLAGLAVVVLATVSFIYLGFSSEPRGITYTPGPRLPRIRTSSLTRPSSLKFAKPDVPARRKSKSKKVKKSNSSPNFNIYL